MFTSFCFVYHGDIPSFSEGNFTLKVKSLLVRWVFGHFLSWLVLPTGQLLAYSFIFDLPSGFLRNVRT
jgi:hypothetical protein